MSTLHYTNDQAFETEVLKSDIPVLVDFYADWCGPCQAIAPQLEDIAQTEHGDVAIVKLDVDANPAAAAAYNVQSIPTLILFKNGEPVERIIGLAPKEEIVSRIREHTASPQIV